MISFLVIKLDVEENIGQRFSSLTSSELWKSQETIAFTSLSITQILATMLVPDNSPLYPGPAWP